MSHVFHYRIFLLGLLLIGSCTASPDPASDPALAGDATCIPRILAQDDSLGTLRNHACKEVPASAAIRTYIRQLQDLDFRGCPAEFTRAYAAHRTAWEGVLPITDRHQELRGEMHDLFDRLERSSDSILFQQRVAAIWSTWDAVEKAANDTPTVK